MVGCWTAEDSTGSRTSPSAGADHLKRTGSMATGYVEGGLCLTRRHHLGRPSGRIPPGLCVLSGGVALDPDPLQVSAS